MKYRSHTAGSLYHQGGVTLLELMIAVSILGVLLAIGVPSYSSITRDNQIAAQSSSLFQSFTLARSEALKRSLRVSVCPIANDDTSTCRAASDWAGGWMIFEDDFGSAGSVDPGDRTLRVFAAAPGILITSTAASVVYLPTAAVQSRADFTISKNGCTAQQRRVVAVEVTGRASLAKTAC